MAERQLAERPPPKSPETKAPAKQVGKQGESRIAKAGKDTRFQPGQSGNPAGRKPNELCLTVLLRQEIDKIPPGEKRGRSWAQLLVIATMKLALSGNSTALKEVWERLDGKVTTPLDFTNPIRLVFGVDDAEL